MKNILATQGFAYMDKGLLFRCDWSMWPLR